jgi:hypothetical protein
MIKAKGLVQHPIGDFLLLVLQVGDPPTDQPRLLEMADPPTDYAHEPLGTENQDLRGIRLPSKRMTGLALG